MQALAIIRTLLRVGFPLLLLGIALDFGVQDPLVFLLGGGLLLWGLHDLASEVRDSPSRKRFKQQAQRRREIRERH